jgi:ferritin
MLNEKMLKAINEQIKNEFYSSYLYLSMAAHFEANNLSGFAQWMRMQSKEEMAHGMKFFDYVLERGGHIELQAIDQPPAKFESALAIFEMVLEHERSVTESIYKLYELALKESDYPTQIELQWFITEQVEEESNAERIIAELKRIEAHETAVLMLDHQLRKRGKE